MAADLGGGFTDADGGPVRHIPVRLSEVLEALAPKPARSSSTALLALAVIAPPSLRPVPTSSVLTATRRPLPAGRTW